MRLNEKYKREISYLLNININEVTETKDIANKLDIMGKDLDEKIFNNDLSLLNKAYKCRINAAIIYESLSLNLNAGYSYDRAAKISRLIYFYKQAELKIKAGNNYLKANNFINAAHCYMHATKRFLRAEDMKNATYYLKKAQDLFNQNGGIPNHGYINSIMRLYEYSKNKLNQSKTSGLETYL